MKNLKSISGAQRITKNDQKAVNGGLVVGCNFWGCTSTFLSASGSSDGDRCAFGDGSGGICRGIIRRGQCCV